MTSKAATPKAASKSAATRKPAAAAAKPVEAKNPEAVDPDDGAKDAAMLKIKVLVDRVITTSGVSNRKNVRQVVEATLAELVKALQAGEAPNLPGVGRLRVANTREDASGLHMTLKLRRPNAKAASEKDGKEALAEVGEDS